MSQDDDGDAGVREQIDKLEEVKDFIVGFLEGAATPDPRTKALWQDDAKEAFFDVAAAYDVLRSQSPRVEEKDRPASALAFLGMAKSRVNQVSSELKTYKTDVADDLVAKFEEAFRGASQAISSKAGVPTRTTPALASQAVVKMGEDEYALLCSACGKVATVFRVEVPRLSKTGERAILLEGITKSIHLDMRNAQVIFERLEQGNLRALHEYVEHAMEGGLDAYCPTCDKVYCKEDYDLDEVWDEGFYDCTYGTCPEGHRRLLDD
jgi:hypothetical protein